MNRILPQLSLGCASLTACIHETVKTGADRKHPKTQREAHGWMASAEVRLAPERCRYCSKFSNYSLDLSLVMVSNRGHFCLAETRQYPAHACMNFV